MASASFWLLHKTHILHYLLFSLNVLSGEPCYVGNTTVLTWHSWLQYETPLHPEQTNLALFAHTSHSIGGLETPPVPAAPALSPLVAGEWVFGALVGAEVMG